MPLLPSLQAFATNPFVLDEATRRAYEGEILALPVHRTVADLLDESGHEAAEEALLAIGFVQAHAGQQPLAELPARTWSRFQGRQEAYRRIALAAGRGYRAIGTMIGASVPMTKVRSQAWAACFGDSLCRILELEAVIRDHDVTILGETGTGKEVVATAIQAALPGNAKGGEAPRAALNAAAIPDTLIESELFGHVKGAFTGAEEARRGRIRTAHGGSFFLDEVGDLKETTQVKLLRVMETNMVSPLGADASERAECRYIAATHKDLEAMVDAGTFRRDLFQRLAGFIIRLPPLRVRREDIPAIGAAFVKRYAVPQEVVARCDAWLAEAARTPYNWPGNVRELQNRLRSVMLGLGSVFGPQGIAATASVVPPAFDTCEATLRELEDWYLARVLAQVEHNYAAASRILGVDRATIRRRAKQLGPSPRA